MKGAKPMERRAVLKLQMGSDGTAYVPIEHIRVVFDFPWADGIKGAKSTVELDNERRLIPQDEAETIVEQIEQLRSEPDGTHGP